MADIADRSFALVDGWGAGYRPTGSPVSPRFTVKKFYTDNGNGTGTVRMEVTLKTNSGYMQGGYSTTLYFKVGSNTVSVPWKAQSGNDWNQNTTHIKNISMTIPLDGTTTRSADLWMTTHYYSTAQTAFTWRASAQGGDSITGVPLGYQVSNFTAFSGFNTGASSISVTVRKRTASVTNKLTLKIGSTTITSWSGLGDVNSVSLSAENRTALNNAIPNATSATATMLMETFNGSSLVGSVSRDATVTVASGIVPSTTSISVVDTVTLVVNNIGAFVQGKTVPKLTINGAVAGQGASIAGYDFAISSPSVQSRTQTSGTSWTGVALVGSGNHTFTVTVRDSRGRTTSRSTTINVLAYSSPKITATRLVRATGTGGTESNEGNYLKFVRNLSISGLSVGGTAKNRMTLTIRVKKVGTSTWVQAYSNTWGYGVSSDNGFTVPTTQYPSSDSYDVEAILKDVLNTESRFVSVLPSASFPMVLGVDNVGVGKVPADGRALDIEGDTHTSGKFYENGLRVVTKAISSRQDLSSVGWYRAIKFSHPTSDTAIDGRNAIQAIIRINRNYANSNNESWTINLNFPYRNPKFTVVSGQVNNHFITKIRAVYVQAESATYIDIYYNNTVLNTVRVTAELDSDNAEIEVSGQSLQTASVPSGAIVMGETDIIPSEGVIYEGTASGGAYRCVRYPNGWQELHWRRSVSTKVNQPTGQLYYSETSLTAENYPYTFIEQPFVSLFISSSDGQLVWAVSNASATATKSPNAWLYKGTLDSNTRTYTFDIKSSGRWK